MNQPAFAEPVPMPVHAAHAYEIVRRLGEPLVGGNQAEVFEHAEETRDTLLGICERALDHINLDAALLHTPGLCADLVACLAEQCRKGVHVQVLAHAMETGEVSAALSELRDAGATVNGISPPHGLLGWIGHRFCSMQRQLAIVDGQIAWCGPGARAHGHGTYGPHLCVQGPIVERLQRLFLEAWHAPGSHSRLPQANYFPPMAASGCLRMGMVLPADMARAPHQGDGALVGVVEAARFHVFISMAQRVPSRRLIQGISAAAGRGVNVSVLLRAGSSQSWQWRSCCSELLRSRAWLYQGDGSRSFPPHCTVDGVWSSFALDGDSNWHTARVGDTAELIVLGAEFAGALETVCHTALTHTALLDAKSVHPPQPLKRLFGAASRAGGWARPSSTPHLPQ